MHLVRTHAPGLLEQRAVDGRRRPPSALRLRGPAAAGPACRMVAVLCLAALAASALAQSPRPVAAPAVETSGLPPEEPRVQRIVVEDDLARVDELRVRGQTQRIVVQPKRLTQTPYEIVVVDAGRDVAQGAGSQRGAAGKSVWSFLRF